MAVPPMGRLHSTSLQPERRCIPSRGAGVAAPRTFQVNQPPSAWPSPVPGRKAGARIGAGGTPFTSYRNFSIMQTVHARYCVRGANLVDTWLHIDREPAPRACRRVFATNLVYVRIGCAGGVPCDGAVGCPMHLAKCIGQLRVADMTDVMRLSAHGLSRGRNA